MPQSYYHVWPLRSATLRNVVRRGYGVVAASDNVARTWSNEAIRKLNFLTYLNFEHVRNSGTFSAMYNGVAATHRLHVTFLTRCDTLCSVMLRDTVAAARLQCGVARHSVTQHNITKLASVTCQACQKLDNNVVLAWLQRGNNEVHRDISWHPAEINTNFFETWVSTA